MMNASQKGILRAAKKATKRNEDMTLSIRRVPKYADETEYISETVFSIKNSFTSEIDDYGAASGIAMDSVIDLLGRSKNIYLNQNQIDRLAFEIELKLDAMIHDVTEAGDFN